MGNTPIAIPQHIVCNTQLQIIIQVPTTEVQVNMTTCSCTLQESSGLKVTGIKVTSVKVTGIEVTGIKVTDINIMTYTVT